MHFRCDVGNDERCESCQQDCTCSEGDWFGLVKSSVPGFVEAYSFDEGENVSETRIVPPPRLARRSPPYTVRKRQSDPPRLEHKKNARLRHDSPVKKMSSRIFSQGVAYFDDTEENLGFAGPRSESSVDIQAGGDGSFHVAYGVPGAIKCFCSDLACFVCW